MKNFHYNGIKLELPDVICQNKSEQNPLTIEQRIKNGFYESQEYLLMQKYITENDVVLELGSCIGYISCVINNKCKQLVSIEPNVELHNIIQHNKKINNCDFILDTRIVHHTDGEIIQFNVHNFILSSCIVGIHGTKDTQTPKKTINVPTVTIQSLENEYNIKFNTLVCDIEGGEYKLFQNNIKTIKDKFEKIIVEERPRLKPTESIPIESFLVNHGYLVIEKIQNVYYFKRKKT